MKTTKKTPAFKKIDWASVPSATDTKPTPVTNPPKMPKSKIPTPAPVAAPVKKGKKPSPAPVDDGGFVAMTDEMSDTPTGDAPKKGKKTRKASVAELKTPTANPAKTPSKPKKKTVDEMTDAELDELCEKLADTIADFNIEKCDKEGFGKFVTAWTDLAFVMYGWDFRTREYAPSAPKTTEPDTAKTPVKEVVKPAPVAPVKKAKAKSKTPAPVAPVTPAKKASKGTATSKKAK